MGAVDPEGNTLLHLCSQLELRLATHKIIAKLNLSVGKHQDYINRKNKAKRTALSIAQEKGAEAIVNMLLNTKKTPPNNNQSSPPLSAEIQTKRGQREGKKKGSASTQYQLKQNREEEDAKDKPEEEKAEEAKR